MLISPPRIPGPSAGFWRFVLGLAAAPILASCRDQGSRAQPLEAPLPSAILQGSWAGGPLEADLVTDAGTVICQLEPKRAPHASALFVGLATGRAAYQDPRTLRPSHGPFYRDQKIFRAIPNVYFQTGDPVGDGSGDPGYRIAVEPNSSDAEYLSTPGALVLARYQPPPGRDDPDPPPRGHVLGSQFAVLLTDMHHLASSVSVLGRCEDLDLARRIALDVGHRTRAHRLERIEIR